MACQYSKILPNLQIIRIRGSEVGLIDLRTSLEDVFRLGIEDEIIFKGDLSYEAA